MIPVCLLSYAWHCSENLRRVSDNNCHSSSFIFIYQSHMTWKGTSLPTELSKWQEQDRLCPIFLAWGFKEQSMYHIHNQNLESSVPHEGTWAFFSPPLSPTAPVLLYLNYIDTRRESSPLCLDMYKAIIQNAGIFLQWAVFDQHPLLSHLKEDKCPVR